MLLTCYVKAAVLEKKEACNNLLHFTKKTKKCIAYSDLGKIRNITNSNTVIQAGIQTVTRDYP
jgi:hypothetical protein